VDWLADTITADDLPAMKRGYADFLYQNLKYAHIEDDGETVRMGALSPGCAICKDGRWDCLFITDACNLDCDFCIQTRDPGRKSHLSALGNSYEDIFINHRAANISGCSYSGGEPLLDRLHFENTHSRMHCMFPDYYYWLYTNGSLLDEETSRWLADIGINEVRINVAATHYEDSRILKHISKAAALLDCVTVEIPLIGEDLPTLLRSLPRLADLGVAHLNMHDLMRESGSRSQTYKRATFCTLALPDGHQTGLAVDSLQAATAVFETISANNIPLSVNYCSIFSQIRQVRQRRKMLQRILAEPFHKLRGDEMWEYANVYMDDGSACAVHPDRLASSPLCKGRAYSLIREFVPLSVQEYEARRHRQPMTVPRKSFTD